MATRTLWTAEELLRLPEDGKCYALVKGELVEMALPGAERREITGRLTTLLGSFVLRQGVGGVLIQAGFLLAKNPDTVRAPDVAFIARDHLPSPRPKGCRRCHPTWPLRSCRRTTPSARCKTASGAWLSAGSQKVCD